MVYLDGEGTVTLWHPDPLCHHSTAPLGDATSSPASHSPPAHLRAFRSPSVLVDGWSFKTLMQPFIWCGEKERL